MDWGKHGWIPIPKVSIDSENMYLGDSQKAYGSQNEVTDKYQVIVTVEKVEHQVVLLITSQD